ncbi:Tat binding protein 1-interacting protein-domain-containing protein [Hyaloraphidium curvatum]|nr:Tat binding protein 1-interacting protein-domain-containing protein [Hyaloraphidium curvatum]
MGKAPAKDKDAAPGKKPRKPAEAKEKVAAADVDGVVLAYLRRQNRPYSAIDVFNNLGGTIPKAQVVKSLAGLFSSNQIHGKSYSKSWIYMARQDEGEAPSQADLEALDAKVADLESKRDDARDENKRRVHELHAALAEPTDAQLEELLPKLRAETEALAARLAALRSNAVAGPSEAEKLAIAEEEARCLGRKRAYARLEADVVGQLCDATQSKPAAFREQVGLED